MVYISTWGGTFKVFRHLQLTITMLYLPVPGFERVM
jgi:hypothetical protein